MMSFRKVVPTFRHHALAPTPRNRLLARLALALGAVAAVAGGIALLVWLLAPAAPPPPARTPFGIGVREAAPSAGGLGGYILAVQAQFYRSLQAAVAALKADGAALWSLIALGFAYGVFHAAGPGHGKAVIAAYLVSSERALAKGLGMSLAAALLQAAVAVALVGTVAAMVRATAATMNEITRTIEVTSFAVVTALGLALVWRKSGKLLAVTGHDDGHAHDGHACGHGCGHVHPPVERSRSWRDMAGVVVAAGIRPCAGAIVVLVFALSQGVFAAGIAATFAMALGTALTTGLIAAVAVFAKALAVQLARGRGDTGSRIVAGLELLAAAFILVLGASLLAGLWTGATAS
ncbi:MAG TPA: nickel/cobalt transporter [Beijerinckiaceae bacterium]|nr:nickel/cobalt transporter [Beijerinckiaceae bacterium]